MNTSKDRSIYRLESVQLHAWEERTLLHIPAGCHRLVYANNGDIEVRSEEMRWKGKAGQVIYAGNRKTVTIASIDEAGACCVLCVQPLLISGEQGRWAVQETQSIAFLQEEGPLEMRGGERIREQIATLCGSEEQDRDWEFQKLMRLLYEEWRDASAGSRSHSGIEQSIEYMKEHYGEKISREKLAHIAGLAPNSFWRSFKREKGMSPIAYMQQIRVEHAKTWLSEGRPMKEVAEASGFGNEFYLSRVFKKWTGLAPSVYVKRHTLKVAVASRFKYQDSLRELGIEPVLAIDCYRHPLLNEGEYETRLFRQTAELRLAAPDLIIGDYSHMEHLDWMKTVAPTVIIPHSLEWKTPFMHLADLVGRSREALQIVERVEQQIIRYAQRIAYRADKPTISMLQIMRDHIIVQGTVNHPLNELLYSELGLSPDRSAPVNEMRQYLQLQDMTKYRSDYICVRLYSEHPQVIKMWERLQLSKFWSELPAVQRGHVHLTGNWLVDSWTPQGRIRIAEQLVDLIRPDVVGQARACKL